MREKGLDYKLNFGIELPTWHYWIWNRQPSYLLKMRKYTSCVVKYI
jgi:hypothetical protein